MIVRRRSGDAAPKRRWLIWAFALAAIVIILAIYETRQELRNQSGQSEAVSSGSPEASHDAPNVAPEMALHRVRSYYRSHELPSGWTVGEAESTKINEIKVSLMFSPGVSSPRHGQAAKFGEILSANACPLEDGLWHEIDNREIQIVVNDKTGVIDRIACRPPDGAD